MSIQKKSVRARSLTLLSDFLSQNRLLDIVVVCSSWGKEIFWGVPYDLVKVEFGNETILELSIKWSEATKTEQIQGIISIDDLPITPFSTKYAVFFKGNNSPLGPISFNTGGGYRYMIYMNAFGHSENDAHINEVRQFIVSDCRYQEEKQ